MNRFTGATLGLTLALLPSCFDSDDLGPDDVESMDAVPVDCEPGDLGCGCNEAGACASGLACSDEEICELCPAGLLGCECEVTGRCEAGAYCSAGVCVEG